MANGGCGLMGLELSFRMGSLIGGAGRCSMLRSQEFELGVGSWSLQRMFEMRLKL